MIEYVNTSTEGNAPGKQIDGHGGTCWKCSNIIIYERQKKCSSGCGRGIQHTAGSNVERENIFPYDKSLFGKADRLIDSPFEKALLIKKGGGGGRAGIIKRASMANFFSLKEIDPFLNISIPNPILINIEVFPMFIQQQGCCNFLYCRERTKVYKTEGYKIPLLKELL